MKKSIFLLLVFVNSLAAQYFYKVYGDYNAGVYGSDAFYQVSDSVYWLAVGSGGNNIYLQKFNGDSVIATYPNYSNWNTGFTDIDMDTTGKLWIPGSSNGVFSFDPSNATWQHFRTENSNIISNSAIAVRVDNYNHVWISHSIFSGQGVSMYNGNTWTTYSTANSPISSNYVYPLTKDDKGRIYIGAWGGYISRFDPSTNTWFNNFNPSVCNGFPSFYNDPDALFATPVNNNLIAGVYGVVGLDSSGNCLFDMQADSINYKSNLNICVIQDSKGYIWVSYSGNYTGVSRFNGANWDFYYIPAYVLWIKEDKYQYKFWTYGGNNLFCLYPDSLVNVSENNNLSQDFSLKQNYPNPFNPTTKISFKLPNGIKNASLTIFNVLGKEVKKWKPNNSGEILWDGTDSFSKPVSSGVYLCQLKVGNFSETKKMLLIK